MTLDSPLAKVRFFVGGGEAKGGKIGGNYIRLLDVRGLHFFPTAHKDTHRRPTPSSTFPRPFPLFGAVRWDVGEGERVGNDVQTPGALSPCLSSHQK